jgi:hypothetical protein
MGAKIISVGEDIRLEPAVDGWALDNERIEAYPRIGDFIALAAITDIPTLRALWLDLYPISRRGKSSISPAVSASWKTAEFSSNRNAAPTFPTWGDGGH